MVNPPLTGCNTKNGATLQKLQEKSPISGKWKRKRLLEIEKKESKKLKRFQKLLDADEPELSVQSEEAEPDQCK